MEDREYDMVAVKNITATIYCGLQEGYDGPIHEIKEVDDICLKYCNEVGLCVTVTETVFVYMGGSEPGAIVGLINYPMYPKTDDELRYHSIELAKRLREGLKQLRVSVVTPFEILTIGEIKK